MSIIISFALSLVAASQTALAIPACIANPSDFGKRTRLLQMAEQHKTDTQFLSDVLASGSAYVVGVATLQEYHLSPGALQCELDLQPSFEAKLDALIEHAESQEVGGGRKVLELVLQNAWYRNLKDRSL